MSDPNSHWHEDVIHKRQDRIEGNADKIEALLITHESRITSVESGQKWMLILLGIIAFGTYTSPLIQHMLGF